VKFEDLNGLPCTAGTPGTISVTYDSARHAVVTCVASSGQALVRVNEFMTGVTGAATNEFVEIVNAGTASADLSGWKLVYRSATGTSDTVLDALLAKDPRSRSASILASTPSIAVPDSVAMAAIFRSSACSRRRWLRARLVAIPKSQGRASVRS